jgi:hypothetical protein
MQLQDLTTRMGQRLDEAAGPVFYPLVERIAALNEAQRFFCLLTLALETTASWTAPGYAANGSSPFHHMLGYFADWTTPLRFATASGAKVRPGRISDFAAADSRWWNRPANPSRYAALGADLVALYGQPAASTPLNVTYVRAPAPLANPTDVPEIPEEYHPELINYGIYRVRQTEGGQEFEKTLAGLDSFFDGAERYATYVRARNKGAGYDKVPFELSSFDRSALLTLGKK